MKKISAFILSAALSACAPVMADTVTLTSGLPGGSYYDVFGVNLAQELSRSGLEVDLVASGGSNANLDAIASGEADLGFSQADVWAASGQTQLKNLGTLGQECIFVAARKGIDDEDDLENTTIAIGADGSGSATTWDYLRRLEDDYRSVKTLPIGDFEALAAVQSGTADAFLWVTSPDKYDHDYLEVVRQSGGALHVINFNDYSINNDLPGGGQVYTFRDGILVDDAGWNTEIETACTDVLVLARPDADPKLTRSVAKAIMLNGDRIRGQ